MLKLTKEFALSIASNQPPSIEELGRIVREGRKGPQVECPLQHDFVPGMYARTVFVPAGTLVITKRHNTTHRFAVTKGRIAVWTEAQGVHVIQAPYRGTTEAGTIRLAVAIQDTVWTTYHETDNTNLVELERELADDPVEILEAVERKNLCQ